MNSQFKKITVILYLVTLTALSAIAAKDSDVVAVINKRSITLGEFNRRYADIRSHAVNPPTREEFLEDLIRYEVGIQEGERQNIQKNPLVRERIQQEIYKGLIEKDIAPILKTYVPTEGELKAWYAQYPEIQSSHILIELKPNATPEQRAEAKKRAEEIYKTVIASDRPFVELANLYSDDIQSKMTGGDIGWQTSISLVPDYYNAILNVPVGKFAPLFESRFGFHIVKVTGRKSYEDANSGQLRAAVIDDKRRKLFNEYFAKLKKSYSITTKPALIK